MTDEYGQAIAGISGLVSWWRFGEAAGATTAIDEQGTQNGAYQGGVALGQAPLPGNTDDTEVALNGTDAFIEVPHHADYNLTAGTALVWFRPTALEANRQLLSKDTSAITAGDLFLGYLTSSNQLRFQIKSASTSNQANATAVLSPNVTYCAAIQWGSGGMRLWLASGGALAQIASNAYTGGINGNVQNWRIGATQWRGSAGDFFAGTLGDVIIWNRQLNAAELQAATRAQLQFGMVDFKANDSRYYSFPHAAVLDFPSGVGAWGVWTKVEDNRGALYQYLLSSGVPGNVPGFNLYLVEATEATNPNRFVFVITDNAGVGGSTVRASSTVTGADGVERLVVVQSTGSAVEMWLCSRHGTATRVYTAALTLGPLTAPVDWNLGRRTDGNASRYWEECLGGLFKADIALSQEQIEQIAAGQSPVAALGANCAAFWPFANVAVPTELDVVGSIAATRQGTWGGAEGIAAGFIQDANISSHAAVVWHENWEDGNTTGWSPFNNSRGSFVINTTAANVHTGTRSLEWVMTQSTSEAGGNINRFLASKVPLLFVRWYAKWEAAWDNSPNYQNHTGCSIRGCGPSGCTVSGVQGDGINKFSVSLEPAQYAPSSPRTQADFPPPGRLELYTYHMDAPGNFGQRIAANLDPAAAQLTVGQWHCIEHMVKVNDVGVANGEVKSWVNGVQILHHTGFRFRSVADLLISEVRLNFYIHENSARTNRVWVDDIVFATEYIGPMRMS